MFAQASNKLGQFKFAMSFYLDVWRRVNERLTAKYVEFPAFRSIST